MLIAMLWTFWISVGLVAYTYAGYPLLVVLLSRQKQDHPPLEYLPSIT